MIFLCDLDGTICDLTHRLHFIGATHDKFVQYDAATQAKDWEGFHAACSDDSPIWPVITVVRALAAAGHTIVYSTGRSDDTSKLSSDWLTKFRLPTPHNIFMRNHGDWREDFIVKSELLDRILSFYEVKAEDLGGAFEDRQQVVDMYRERGVKVFQVAPGKY